jgi:hypothetical protein
MEAAVKLSISTASMGGPVGSVSSATLLIVTQSPPLPDAPLLPPPEELIEGPSGAGRFAGRTGALRSSTGRFPAAREPADADAATLAAVGGGRACCSASSFK